MPSDIARYCPPDIRMKILSTANGARQRARTRGLPVDADLCAFALELYSAQGGCCALSGLPFNLRVVGGGKARRPYAPSLDRVDAASGYTRDNVRLVCQAVNFALNAYGEDVFREIALATARFVPERIEPLAATKPSRVGRTITTWSLPGTPQAGSATEHHEGRLPGAPWMNAGALHRSVLTLRSRL
jgi:hypothetical protein